MDRNYEDYYRDAAQESFEWIKHMLSLATGALVLSVTLRKDLSGADPHHIWLLQTAWIALAAAVLSGAQLLFCRVELARAFAHAARETCNTPPPQTVHTTILLRIYRPLLRIFVALLIVALLSLTAFAIVNT